MHICTKYHAGRPFDIKVMLWKSMLNKKAKLLTLDSKIKVTVTSFWYTTLGLVLINAYMYQCTNKKAKTLTWNSKETE